MNCRTKLNINPILGRERQGDQNSTRADVRSDDVGRLFFNPRPILPLCNHRVQR